jgi:pyrimidine operon attenuation protein/uracil phosphoribosyltransferase
MQPPEIPDAEAALSALAERMRPAVAFNAAFVGIYSGGAWIADRLASMIPGEHPVGYIDVSFYRDDYARAGLKAGAKRSELPFDVVGATIVLVDDVLYTGRSVRAAITNSSTTAGRRASNSRCWWTAAAAVPIEATYCGARLAVALTCRSCWRMRAIACASASRRQRAPDIVRNPQLNAAGELTHLLTLEGLPRR